MAVSIKSHVLTITEVTSKGPWICTRFSFLCYSFQLSLLWETPKNGSRCVFDSFDSSWDTLVKHDPNDYFLSIFVYIVLYIFFTLSPLSPLPSTLMLKFPIYSRDLVFFYFPGRLDPCMFAQGPRCSKHTRTCLEKIICLVDWFVFLFSMIVSCLIFVSLVIFSKLEYDYSLKTSYLILN